MPEFVKFIFQLTKPEHSIKLHSNPWGFSVETWDQRSVKISILVVRGTSEGQSTRFDAPRHTSTAFLENIYRLLATVPQSWHFGLQRIMHIREISGQSHKN